MSKFLKLDIKLEYKESTSLAIVPLCSFVSDRHEMYDKGYRGDYSIDEGVVDQEISLGGLNNTHLLLLQTDNDIHVKLNSVDNTSFLVTKLFLIDSNINKLYVSNLSSSKVVNLTVIALEKH